MNIEEKVKANLLVRGFDNKTQLNNRGLIGATIDETILEVVKNLLIADVMRWVAVSERTPETNALCLCATEYGYSFRYWKGNHFEGEHVANEPKVTHWMYAPEPPVMCCGLTEVEFTERERLLKLQRSRTRWFSQQEFDRLKELSEKMFANAGSPHST